MAIRPRSTPLSYLQKAGVTILAAFLLALLLVPAPSRAQSSGSTKWLATFSGSGNGGETQPLAIAADPQGNVYVTGWDQVSTNYCPPPTSCTQAVTIKYDPSGKALWKDWLTSSGVAQGRDIAVDSAGNAYVLFNFTRQGAHPIGSEPDVPEVVTAKYNPAGGRDWINFINSSPDGTVQRMPVGMAVSPAGNVYVTYQENGTHTETIVTIKYDTAGHTIWSQTISDEAGANPGATAGAIGIDANENVYVPVHLTSTVGSPGNLSTVNDGEIVKYDSNGVRLASIGRGQITGANGFHVDPDGACYLNTGSIATTDFVVAKFNPDQTLAYTVDITKLEGIGGPFGPPFGPDSIIEQIASDSAGNAFVLQRFDQTGPHADGDVASVLKLDPSGHELFVTRYNQNSDQSGRDNPVALAVAPSGDFYLAVSGQPEDPSANSEFITIKYNNAGVRQWLAQHTSPSQDGVPKAMSLSVGNLVVTGWILNSEDWSTIAYVP